MQPLMCSLDGSDGLCTPQMGHPHVNGSLAPHVQPRHNNLHTAQATYLHPDRATMPQRPYHMSSCTAALVCAPRNLVPNPQKGFFLCSFLFFFFLFLSW
ncbi:hypothetical protein PAXRUDRAFT_690159 [Paxillus rubicundulus Ve08.2h10]|uniref:Uncharacterized protein n=1 Tax=Paxillus rubicundulus Ve08.2h10 TaxID=930991 RepID=A0A0D0DN20_9AGAM|nr:hypothetical protein PAXRUDRAFT_690159 [Paxillus rubicundulus Ve08.2h10]